MKTIKIINFVFNEVVSKNLKDVIEISKVMPRQINAKLDSDIISRKLVNDFYFEDTKLIIKLENKKVLEVYCKKDFVEWEICDNIEQGDFSNSEIDTEVLHIILYNTEGKILDTYDYDRVKMFGSWVGKRILGISATNMNFIIEIEGDSPYFFSCHKYLEDDQQFLCCGSIT